MDLGCPRADSSRVFAKGVLTALDELAGAAASRLFSALVHCLTNLARRSRSTRRANRGAQNECMQSQKVSMKSKVSMSGKN
jgi:hypothetical protein